MLRVDAYDSLVKEIIVFNTILFQPKMISMRGLCWAIIFNSIDELRVFWVQYQRRQALSGRLASDNPLAILMNVVLRFTSLSLKQAGIK